MRPRLNFSPRQSRAARALLDMPADRLASIAGLEAEAVELFEAGQGELSAADHEALCEALYGDGWGVIAIRDALAGEGVRFARPVSVGSILSHRLAQEPPRPGQARRSHGDW